MGWISPNEYPKEEMNNDDNVAQILDAGKALGLPIDLSRSEGREVVVVPANYRVQEVESLIEKYLPAPRRTKVGVRLDTLDSFIDYVKEHKSESLRIFTSLMQTVACDPNRGQATAMLHSVVAYIDCHTPGKPSWREHYAAYSPLPTREWTAWQASNKRRMDQTEFATFLEEQQAQVTSPNGAELLELVTTLEGKSDACYTAVTRLNNGKVSLAYSQEVSLRGAGTQSGVVELPGQIVVALAAFEGGTLYNVPARLRYRLNSGSIELWYELVTPHLLVKQAITEMLDKISAELGVKPFCGML